MPLTDDDVMVGGVQETANTKAGGGSVNTYPTNLDTDNLMVDDTAQPQRNPVKNAVDYIGRGFNYTRRDTSSAVGWFNALMGEISDEEAMAKYSPSAIEQAEINGMLDYEEHNPITLERAAKEIVGIVPYLMQNVQDTIPFAAGGAAVGAGIGAVGGGSAVTFTPAVGGAPITIPGGAAAGATVGAGQGFNMGVRTGVMYSAGRIAAGRMYRDLRAAGVPRDVAISRALAAGAFGGVLQGWQYSRFPTVIKTAIGREAAKKSFVDNFLSLAKEVGIQVTAADVNLIADTVIKNSAGAVVEWDKFQKQFIETSAKAAFLTATGVGGLQGIGKGLDMMAAKSRAGQGGSAADTAAIIQDVLTISKSGENQKLLQLKAELKVAKAEEKLANVRAKYREAVSEGKPTGAAKLEIEVAKEELKEAKSQLPMASLLKSQVALRGRIQKMQDDAAEPTEQEAEANVAVDQMTAEQRMEHYKGEIANAKDTVNDLKKQLDKADSNEDTSGIEALLVRARRNLRKQQRNRRDAEWEHVNEQVDAVISAAKAKYFIEKDQTPGEAIKENQQIITDLIRKSPIDNKYKARFIAKIKETQTQNQLIRIADGYTVEPTTLSGKPSKNAGKFIPGLRQTIVEIINDVELAEAHADLKAVLKEVQPTNPKARVRKSKFSVDVQDAINAYQEFIEIDEKGHFLPPTKAEAWIKETNNLILDHVQKVDQALINGNMPDPEPVMGREIKNIIANDTLIDYNDSQQVQSLADKVAELAYIGKHKLASEREADMKVRRELAADLYDDIQGEKKHQIDVSDPTPQRISKGKELALVGGTNLAPWNVLMGHITQHSIEPKSLDRLAITDVLVKTHNAIAAEHDRALEIVFNNDEEAYKNAIRIAQTGGDRSKSEKKGPGWGKYTSWDYVKDEQGNIVRDEDGKPFTYSVERDYHATEGQVIQDMMDMMNAASNATDVDGFPKMYKGMAFGSKFTFDDPAKNVHPLGPGETSFQRLLAEIALTHPYLEKIAKGGIKYYNDAQTYKQMNDMNRKVFGFDMPKTELYTGPRSRKGFEGQEGSNYERLVNGAMSTTKKSLTPDSIREVVQSEKPYVRADFFHNLSRHIHDTQNFINLYETERLLSYVFSRPQIRETIRRKFESEESGSIMKQIDHQFMSMVGTRSIQHVQRIEWIDNLRSRVGPAFTYGKPLNLIGQISSIHQIKNYISDAEFKDGMDYAQAHPLEVYNVMKELPLWKARYDSYANELVERRQQQGIFGEKLDPKIIQATGLALTLGDKYVYVVGGYAVRKAYIARGIEKGMTEKEAIEYGNSMAQRAINETQGSALRDQVTFFENGGSANKAMVIFGKPTIQQAAATALAIRRTLANPNLKTLDDARRVIANYMLSSALFTAWQSLTFLAWKGLTDNIEDKDAMAELNKVIRYYVFPWLSLPVLGDIANPIINNTQVYAEEQLANAGLMDEKAVPEYTNFKNVDPQFVPFRIIKAGVTGPMKLGSAVKDVIEGEPIPSMKIYAGVIDMLSSWALLGTSLPLLPVAKLTKPVVKATEPPKKKKPKMY